MGGWLRDHTVRAQVPDNPTHYERMAGGGRRAAKISSNWDPYLKGEEATIPEMSKLQVGLARIRTACCTQHDMRCLCLSTLIKANPPLVMACMVIAEAQARDGRTSPLKQ